MIVRMKKLTVLCLTSDRDEALGALRDLGVVHVTDRRPPAGDDLDALRDRLAATQRALSGLPKKAPAARRRAAQRRPANRPRPATWSRTCSPCSTAATRSSGAVTNCAGSSPGTPGSARSTSTRCASSSGRACGRPSSSRRPAST